MRFVLSIREQQVDWGHPAEAIGIVALDLALHTRDSPTVPKRVEAAAQLGTSAKQSAASRSVFAKVSRGQGNLATAPVLKALSVWGVKTAARAIKSAITSGMGAIVPRIKIVLNFRLMGSLPEVFAWMRRGPAGIVKSPMVSASKAMFASMEFPTVTAVDKNAIPTPAITARPESVASHCREMMAKPLVGLVFPEEPNLREKPVRRRWIVLKGFCALVLLAARCACGNVTRKIPIALMRAKLAMLFPMVPVFVIRWGGYHRTITILVVTIRPRGKMVGKPTLEHRAEWIRPLFASAMPRPLAMQTALVIPNAPARAM